MLPPPEQLRPIVCTLFGACLISFSAIWVKMAQVDASVSAFYRVFFGFFFLLTASLLRRDTLKQDLHLTPWFGLCGFLFALDIFFWHCSIPYLGPGLATIVGNFQIFMVTAIGFFFLGERLRPRFILSLPLAMAGLFLVIGMPEIQPDSPITIGLIYGLLTAACYTGFLLSLKKIQVQRHSPYSNLMLVSLASALFLAMGVPAGGSSFLLPSMTSLVCLLCLGLFSQTIGWALIADAMPKIRTSLTGFILLLQPALAFVWDVLLFDRPTALMNWAGVLLTLAAIYMGMTGKEKVVTTQVLSKKTRSSHHDERGSRYNRPDRGNRFPAEIRRGGRA